MDFKKIKFNKSAMLLEVTYFEHMEVNEAPVSNEVVKKCSMIVHQDFIDALNGLKVHFALLCDLREVNNFPKRYDVSNFDNEAYLEKIKITGISLGGDDDSAGVVIIGQKELTSGVLNLVTPFTRFDGDYEWADALSAAVEHVTDEVEHYLFDQKWGVKQLEFDFAEEFEEPCGTFEDINPGETTGPVKEKKAKSRKKKVETEVFEQAS